MAFVKPTNFEITLEHEDKNVLIPVVHYLLEGNAAMAFDWEMVMLEKTTVYRLSIDGAWADNLEEIARLLGDYGQEND